MLKYSEKSRLKLKNLKVDTEVKEILIKNGVKGIWLHHTGYAYTKFKGRNTSIHQLIIEFIFGKVKEGFEIDHKNQVKLDCRLQNLRVVTKRINRINRGLQLNNTTGYKGVSKHKKNGTYVANIGKTGKNRNGQYLGSYKTAELAAEAYNKAAIIRFGEYAVLNKI